MAVEAHADQLDRDGRPHIEHIARVAAAVPATEPMQRVAWLHDILEDTDYEAALLEHAMPPLEWTAIRLLTRQPHMSYRQYVRQIIDYYGEAGHIARTVKEADLRDNLARCVATADPAIERYASALAELWSRG